MQSYTDAASEYMAVTTMQPPAMKQNFAEVGSAVYHPQPKLDHSNDPVRFVQATTDEELKETEDAKELAQ
jgi:hypothetical protein